MKGGTPGGSIPIKITTSTGDGATIGACSSMDVKSCDANIESVSLMPVDVRTFNFDYSIFDEIAVDGDHLVSCTIEEQSAGITASVSLATPPTSINLSLSGATAGTSYKVVFSGTFNSSNALGSRKIATCVLADCSSCA